MLNPATAFFVSSQEESLDHCIIIACFIRNKHAMIM